VAELLDGMLDEPALVIGSPPPHGHDLDLLVSPGQERALESILVGARFVCQVVAPFRGYPKGFRIWVRFRGCDADVVDAIPVGNLELPRDEVERLFAEAQPIMGFARLVRPAPHHVLLILAHNFLDPADGQQPLSAGRRERVRRALAEEPAAWKRARALAQAWRSPERLVRLGAAFNLDEAAAADAPQSKPAPPGAGLRPRLQAIRAYRRAWRHGRVIGFSGLDGPDRSEQAEGLRRALMALDIPARLERPSLEPALRGALGALLRLRRRSPLLAHASALVAALAHAAAVRRAVLPGLRAGEIVICDRYTLDASVLLRVLYGEQRRFRLQTAVLHLVTPRPRRAYLIDSPGPQAALYREQCSVLGVRPLDGTRAREDLCAEVALDVWRAVRC
jgi:thymidylate kinase